jgi:transposase-like protein
MPGHGEQLSRKQEAAIAALLSEKTVAEAAAKAGVGEKTLRTWLKKPSFAKAFADARQVVLSQTVTQLLQATEEAVETLKDELDGEKGSDRIKAAIAILDRAVKGVEQLDLAGQIGELRREIEELKRHGHSNLAPGSEPIEGEAGDATAASTPADAGADPPNAVPGDGAGGDETGSLADGIAPLPA